MCPQIAIEEDQEEKGKKGKKRKKKGKAKNGPRFKHTGLFYYSGVTLTEYQKMIKAGGGEFVCKRCLTCEY